MLLQPITVPFSKSTLKPSVYTLRPKYSIELNAVFKIMDISGLTLPTSDISSEVHC